MVILSYMIIVMRLFIRRSWVRRSLYLFVVSGKPRHLTPPSNPLLQPRPRCLSLLMCCSVLANKDLHNSRHDELARVRLFVRLRLCCVSLFLFFCVVVVVVLAATWWSAPPNINAIIIRRLGCHIGYTRATKDI